MSPLGGNLNAASTSNNSPDRHPAAQSKRSIWADNGNPNPNFYSLRKSTLKSNFGFDQFRMKVGQNFVNESSLTDISEQEKSLTRSRSLSTDGTDTDDGSSRCRNGMAIREQSGQSTILSDSSCMFSAFVAVEQSPAVGQHANQPNYIQVQSFNDSFPSEFSQYHTSRGEAHRSPEILSDVSNSSSSVGSAECLAENYENASNDAPIIPQNTPYVFIDEVELGTFSSGRQLKSAFHSSSGHGGFRHTSTGTKRKRMRMAPEQLQVLQKAFEHNRMPTAHFRTVLAKRLGMTARSVQIWFQNRRAKVKQNSKNTPNRNEAFQTETGEDGNSLMWQSFCHSLSSDPNEDSVEHAVRSLPLTPRPSSEGFPLYGRHSSIGSLTQISTEFAELPTKGNSAGLVKAVNSVMDILTPFPSDSQLYFGSDSIYSEQTGFAGARGLLYFQNDQLALPMVRQQSPFAVLGRSASFCNVNSDSNFLGLSAVSVPVAVEMPEWQPPNTGLSKLDEHGADAVQYEDNFCFLLPDPLNACPSALDCIEDAATLRHDPDAAKPTLFDVHFNCTKKQRSFSTSDIFGSFNNNASTTGHPPKSTIVM